MWVAVVRVAVALFLLFSFPAPGLMAADQRVDDEALSVFAALLNRASYLPPKHEAAAFMVRASDHDVRCVAWPVPVRAREATYRGVIPFGTIAIAHTHPDFAARTPSFEDVELARKSGLPVYVVTRGEIWIAEGVTGNVSRVEGRGGWSGGVRPRTDCEGQRTLTASVRTLR